MKGRRVPVAPVVTRDVLRLEIRTGQARPGGRFRHLVERRDK